MSSTKTATLQDEEKDKAPHRFWLKIFNEIQTDMRFVTMSHESQGIYFNLLVLANTPFTVGRITAPREDLARGLRITRQKLDRALSEYETKSLVFIEGDTIEIADERHYTGAGLNPSDSREAKADRMREHRARVKAAEQQRQLLQATSDSNASPAKEDLSSVEVDEISSESNTSKFFSQQEEVSDQVFLLGDCGLGPDDEIPLL